MRDHPTLITARSVASITFRVDGRSMAETFLPVEKVWNHLDKAYRAAPPLALAVTIPMFQVDSAGSK